MKHILIFLVKCYQLLLSPLFSGSCRFYPSCSNYSIQALKNRGAIEGTYLSVKRVIRCNPYCEGGYDPVPHKEHKCNDQERTESFSQL
jgi:putative membrane protein insertion efficiency factor